MGVDSLRRGFGSGRDEEGEGEDRRTSGRSQWEGPAVRRT